MKYKPIACQDYDRLELYASRRQPVSVLFSTEDGALVRKEAVVLKDLQSIKGEEYLCLDDGSQAIRLDRLIEVENEIFSGHCKV